jgi:hypothetical protein
MRAFEITILMIMILTVPNVIAAMAVVPSSLMTCTGTACEVQAKLYSFATGFTLNEVDFTANPGTMILEAATLAVTFPIWAMLWLLYFLSMIVLIKPAMVSLFHVPDVMATWLNVGLVILWMAAYIQWKRGGLGLDASR